MHKTAADTAAHRQAVTFIQQPFYIGTLLFGKKWLEFEIVVSSGGAGRVWSVRRKWGQGAAHPYSSSLSSHSATLRYHTPPSHCRTSHLVCVIRTSHSVQFAALGLGCNRFRNNELNGSPLPAWLDKEANSYQAYKSGLYSVYLIQIL